MNVWLETNVRCPVCRHDILTPIDADLNQQVNPDTTQEAPDQLPSVANTTNRTNSNTTDAQLDTMNTNRSIVNRITEYIFNEISNPDNLNYDNHRVDYDASNNTILFEYIYPRRRPNH